MGYTRTWTPATIPFRNNLTAWITICKEIHAEMIAAGLDQTADTGQLADFDAIGTLPADGAFAGYRMYTFSDSLSATCPIFIRLDFGCEREGNTSNNTSLVRPRTLRIKVQIGKSTNGAGVLGSLSPAISYQCPQEYIPTVTGTATTELTSAGTSIICYNESLGFFGFFYGLGSRNKPYAGTGGGTGLNTGNYYGCSLGILIQRDTDSAGTPIDTGFTVWHQDTSGNWNTEGWTVQSKNVNNTIRSVYIPKTGTSTISSTSSAARPGSIGATPVGGVPQVHPVYAITPEVKRVQSIVSYTVSDISTGTEFQLEVKPGTTRNFIALGNENRLSPEPYNGDLSAIAMLYE